MYKVLSPVCVCVSVSGGGEGDSSHTVAWQFSMMWWSFITRHRESEITIITPIHSAPSVATHFQVLINALYCPWSASLFHFSLVHPISHSEGGRWIFLLHQGTLCENTITKLSHQPRFYTHFHITASAIQCDIELIEHLKWTRSLHFQSASWRIMMKRCIGGALERDLQRRESRGGKNTSIDRDLSHSRKGDIHSSGSLCKRDGKNCICQVSQISEKTIAISFILLPLSP